MRFGWAGLAWVGRGDAHEGDCYNWPVGTLFQDEMSPLSNKLWNCVRYSNVNQTYSVIESDELCDV
jgi:hypothetical protein